MSRKRNARSPYDTITSNLGQLTRSELEDLADIVGRLIAIAGEEQEEEEEDWATDVSTNGVKAGGAGHIEYKIINGCGPYAYLRRWQGKKLRSIYLGKVGKDGAIIQSKGGSAE